MRRYFLSILFQKLKNKPTNSCLNSISSLKESKNNESNKKQMKLFDTIESYQFTEKFMTQCSSEIKEIKLEDFYRNDSLENVLLL